MVMIKELFSKPVYGKNGTIGDVLLGDGQIADAHLDDEEDYGHGDDSENRHGQHQKEQVGSPDLDYKKSKEPDDSQLVAEYYAELLNLIHDHGERIPDHILEIVNLALHDGHHEIHYGEDTDGFEVVDMDETEPQQFHAIVRAPHGGLVVGGKRFRGGTYIPVEDMKRMTPEEKKIAYAQLRMPGADPMTIAQLLARKNEAHQRGEEKRSSISRTHQALSKAHGDQLDKALGAEGHELSMHTEKSKGEHKDRLHNRLQDVGDLMATGSEGSGASGGASGGASPDDGLGVSTVAKAIDSDPEPLPADPTTPPDWMKTKPGDKPIQGQPPIKKPVQQYQKEAEVIEREEHKLLALALEALARKSETHTHVHIPESLKMEIPVPIVNVAVPEQKAPDVKVQVAAPEINVEAPIVHVAAPEVKIEPTIVVEQKPVKKTVTKKDADGNPIEILEQPIE